MVRKVMITIVLLAALALAGCAGAVETPGPDSPVDSGELTPGEPVEATPGSEPAATPTGIGADMVQAPAYLDQVDLIIKESYPIQVDVALQGNLPTPCHQLAWGFEVDDDRDRIDLEVFSVAPDQDLACAQVLQEFEQSISLGSFAGASYDVYVNGDRVGSFDS